ncbi:hypothetical protein PybrP1_011842 [[Pythium] brassicae (nom. inval.)]|nr:hypothetical protein PybrP1_011842 [[Pythium] brassicae (nom. inval.)]
MTAWNRETLIAAVGVGVGVAAATYALQRRDTAVWLRALGVTLVKMGRPSAPRMSLAELQRRPPVGAWVALCGTVFDVSEDPFFDASTGVYALWTGHDVTYLLVQMGVALDGADDAAMASYRDQQLPIERVADGGEGVDLEQRQRALALLKEWYVRFHSRYDVVAQIADLFAGTEWDAIRDQLLPPAAHVGPNGERPRGKCPMGFGSRALDHVVSRADPNSKELRTVTFQGKRYDVTNSSLFQDEGAFAHFVGRDITFALATQSVRSEDLGVQPQREYTYEEQVLLERYRVAFARELPLLAAAAAVKIAPSDAAQEPADVHALISACEEGSDKALDALRALLAAPESSGASVNQVCARSTMTPLHRAVEMNRLDLVELLVRAGADQSAEAALYDYETPLQMAERFRFADIAAFLAAHKA